MPVSNESPNTTTVLKYYFISFLTITILGNVYLAQLRYKVNGHAIRSESAQKYYSIYINGATVKDLSQAINLYEIDSIHAHHNDTTFKINFDFFLPFVIGKQTNEDSLNWDYIDFITLDSMTVKDSIKYFKQLNLGNGSIREFYK